MGVSLLLGIVVTVVLGVLCFVALTSPVLTIWERAAFVVALLLCLLFAFVCGIQYIGAFL